MEILRRRSGPDKGLDIVERPNGLSGEAGGDEAADEDAEGEGGGSEVGLVHLDNELPNDVELTDLAEDVDEEVVGGGGEGREREGFGKVEKGEGNLGRVGEAEEGLVEEVGGKRDAVELERGFHGVEGVVVVKEDLGDHVGVV